MTTATTTATKISVSHLYKRYGSHQVIDDVSFDVQEGQVTLLAGPNGAGKSTLLRMICGLDTIDKGDITIMGRHYSQLSDPKHTIGALLDATWLDTALTAEQNLRVLADLAGIHRRRVANCLEMCGLTSVAGRKVSDFSLGMRQRCGIAAALLGDPDLLILDEPVNGLDPAGVAEIRELIVSLARQEGVTIIVSSHILSEIEQMADVVGIICAGSLRYQGPLSGLQDEGVIDFTVSDPAGAAALFAEQRIAHRVRGRTVRTPMLPDEAVGGLVTRIVRAGGTVFRVQTVRKTLEQAFLELTDPLGHQHRPGPAADAVPLTTGQGAQR